MIATKLGSDFGYRPGIFHTLKQPYMQPVKSGIGDTKQGAWTQGTVHPHEAPITNYADWPFEPDLDAPADARDVLYASRNQVRTSWSREMNPWNHDRSVLQPHVTPSWIFVERARAVQHDVWISDYVLRELFLGDVADRVQPPPRDLFSKRTVTFDEKGNKLQVGGWFHLGAFTDKEYEFTPRPNDPHGNVTNRASPELIAVIRKGVPGATGESDYPRSIADIMWEKIFRYEKPYGGGAVNTYESDLKNFEDAWYGRNGQQRKGYLLNPDRSGQSIKNGGTRRFMVCQPVINNLTGLHILVWSRLRDDGSAIRDTFYQAIVIVTRTGGLSQMGISEDGIFDREFTDPQSAASNPQKDFIFHYCPFRPKVEAPGTFTLTPRLGKFFDPNVPEDQQTDLYYEAPFEGPPGSESYIVGPNGFQFANLVEQCGFRYVRTAKFEYPSGRKHAWDFTWFNPLEDGIAASPDAANGGMHRAFATNEFWSRTVSQQLADNIDVPRADMTGSAGFLSRSAHWIAHATARLHRWHNP